MRVQLQSRLASLKSCAGEVSRWGASMAGTTRGALTRQSLSRRTRFRCAALKVAMIKNQHLAESLFGGNVYDCVCLFEPAG